MWLVSPHQSVVGEDLDASPHLAGVVISEEGATKYKNHKGKGECVAERKEDVKPWMENDKQC